MQKIFESIIDTPIGRLRLQADDCSLIYLQPTRLPEKASPSLFLAEAQKQISAYLTGITRSFEIDLAPTGTDFQRRVWKAIMETNAGELLTYQDLAEKIQHPNAARAVGSALSKNPILLVIPCHRVVLKSGDIGNYVMGKDIKQKLLQLEGALT